MNRTKKKTGECIKKLQIYVYSHIFLCWTLVDALLDRLVLCCCSKFDFNDQSLKRKHDSKRNLV